MRDKLIELIIDGFRNCTKPHEVCSQLDLEALADYLIAHGVTVQQWIPVSERLPEIHTLVLVVIKHVAGGSVWATSVGFCEYNAQSKTFDANIGEIVTHWMPLPGKPKEAK